MRVFMLGWEFPPFISGGLGTACYGLTKAMSGIGTDIMFVLPRPVSTPFSTHVRLVSPRPDSPLAAPASEFRLDEFDHVSFRTVNAQGGDAYARPDDYVAPKPTTVEERQTVRKATQVELSPDPVPTPTKPTAQATAGADKATPGFIGAAQPVAGHYGGDL